MRQTGPVSRTAVYAVISPSHVFQWRQEIPLSNYALDKFVAQDLSQLTAPTAKPVGVDYAEAGGWLSMFVLNSILARPVSRDQARVAFAWLWRANAAIENYDEACASLQSIARKQKVVTEYFRAIARIEIAIAMLYQAHDIARRAWRQKLFKKGDGSPLDRVNSIYNTGRHQKLSEFPETHLHPVWLKNDGVYSLQASVRYSELEVLLRQFASTADQIAGVK